MPGKESFSALRCLRAVLAALGSAEVWGLSGLSSPPLLFPPFSPSLLP